MKTINCNVKIGKTGMLDEVSKDHILNNYGGNVARWKMDAVFTHLTKMVNSVYTNKQTGQPSMTFDQIKMWGKCQKAFLEAEGWKVELSDEAFNFMFEALPKATFESQYAMFIMDLLDHMTEVKMNGENVSNLSEDPEFITRPEPKEPQNEQPIQSGNEGTL